MNNSLVHRIQTLLSSQHYVTNEDWLAGCIEFCKSATGNVSPKDIVEFAKDQWQLTNLREINNENGCLPPNLAKQKVTTLPGTYILQMEKMYDIATPKFKQLEEIKRVSTANIEATETETLESWEPKKKRMLQLHLTDGVQDVTAIEYNTISSLNDTLLPGSKVMIIGPVTCRRGVILLEANKFKEIGGEVEELIIPNAVENVLARALELPENPDPYNDKKANLDHNEKHHSTTVENHSNFVGDELELGNRVTPSIQNERHNSNDRIRNSNFIRNTEAKNQNTKNESLKAIEILDDNDEFLNEINEEELCVNLASTTKNQSRKPHIQDSFNQLNYQRREFSEEEFSDDDFATQPSTRNLTCDQQIKENPIGILNYEDFDDFDNFKIEANASHTKSIPKSIPGVAKASTENENSVASNFFSSAERKCKLTEGSAIQETKNTQPSSSTSNTPSVSWKKILTSPLQTKLSEVSADTPSTTGQKRSAAFISPPNTNSTKIHCNKETPKLSKITSFIEKSAYSAEQPPPKMCEFICDLYKETVTDVIFKTIRARVTVLGKLGKRDNCWEVEATITDGTGSIDIIFGSSVLEQLLGFTAQEFSQKKKLRKNNPEIDCELRKGCRNAEQKLKELDDLVELELRPDKKPKILHITYLTTEQKDLIDKRLKLLMI